MSFLFDNCTVKFREERIFAHGVKEFVNQAGAYCLQELSKLKYAPILDKDYDLLLDVKLADTSIILDKKWIFSGQWMITMDANGYVFHGNKFTKPPKHGLYLLDIEMTSLTKTYRIDLRTIHHDKLSTQEMVREIEKLKNLKSFI